MYNAYGAGGGGGGYYGGGDGSTSYNHENGYCGSGGGGSGYIGGVCVVNENDKNGLTKVTLYMAKNRALLLRYLRLKLNLMRR